jgi:hypothetical protein
MIHRAKAYAPHLSNYSAAAGGRSFPFAAGFHTSKTFFTDNQGVYLLDNRDSAACADRALDGSLSFDAALEAVKSRIKKVREGRLGVPPEVPYVEPHYTCFLPLPVSLHSPLSVKLSGPNMRAECGSIVAVWFLGCHPLKAY